MELCKFEYNENSIKQLKSICDKCESPAIKRTFDYLRILFYFSKDKIISEFIPDVAYYVATFSRNKIRIVDIAISKEYQRKGLGTILINRIKAIAKAKGINKITLRTSSEETAFMFYQKLGFNEVCMNGNDIEMELII